MKTYRNDTPPDGLRRKLLLSLPGTLALSSPFALIGCGGGGGDDPTPPTDTGGTNNDPPGPLAASVGNVQIALPADIAAAAGAMRLMSVLGVTAVAGNSAPVNVIDGGPQLVSVIGADGYTRAMGWAGSDQLPIGMTSTAVVLLAFGLGLAFLGPRAREALRARLKDQPTVAAYGERIAAELRANPAALSNITAGILEGFEQAAAALLPEAAPAPAFQTSRLRVDPPTQLSGLQVVQGDTLNSFFVDNTYARRAMVIVNREGWVLKGTADEIPDPQAPVQIGEVMNLPLPTAADSVANIVGSWATEYYSPDDPNGVWRSVSDTITLDVTPEGAKQTRYTTVLLMAGALPPADDAEFARLPASQKAYITGLDLDKNLILQTLLLDLLAPLFFEFLSGRIGAADKNASAASQADAEVLKAFAGQMLSILQTQVPALTQQLSDGSTDAWTAFKTIMRACTVDLSTGEVSPLLKEFLTQGATLLAKALADAGLRSRVLDVATGFNLGNKNVLGFLPVLNILSKFDTVLGKAALARIVADGLRSRRMETYQIRATLAKVTLTPSPFKVDILGVTYPITANIVDNDNADGVEQGSIDFDWECTGLYGTLYSAADSNLANPNVFTSSKNNATPNYIPKGIEPDPAQPETISVRAYFQPIGSGGERTLIGTAKATVAFAKAFNLMITPASGTELPTDTEMAITAVIKEPLPAGTTVDWEWTHGGVGGVSDIAPDGNPRDSSVNFNTASTEGSATVSARATVRVPTGATTPPLVVVTDPVSTQLNVKKGLKTITVEGYWVVEPGTSPRTPSCFIDGVGKEACFLGYLDTWITYVLPKVANAAQYQFNIYQPNGGLRVSLSLPHSNIVDGGSVLRWRYWGADGPYGSYDGASNLEKTQAGAIAYLTSRVTNEGSRVAAVVTLKA